MCFNILILLPSINSWLTYWGVAISYCIVVVLVVYFGESLMSELVFFSA